MEVALVKKRNKFFFNQLQKLWKLGGVRGDCTEKVHFARRFAICLKNPCYMNISFSPRIERPSMLR